MPFVPFSDEKYQKISVKVTKDDYKDLQWFSAHLWCEGKIRNKNLSSLLKHVAKVARSKRLASSAEIEEENKRKLKSYNPYK
jgi:hypothetical protein